MEIALDKMKIGDSHRADPESESDVDDHDRTGVGLVEYVSTYFSWITYFNSGNCFSEAVTSVINPWDREVRFEILKRCRKPCYQHDFDVSRIASLIAILVALLFIFFSLYSW